MDFPWSLLLYGSAIVAGLLPTLLLLVALFRKKIWEWWRRVGWPGSLLLAVINMVLKAGAMYWAFGMKAGLGYSEFDAFTAIYRGLNFLDVQILNGVTHVAQNILSGGHVDGTADNVGMLADFIVVFVLFQVALSVKKTFDNRKTGPDVHI